MNILHVGKYYPPFNGGMETFLRDLAEQQTQRHRVTVLVHNHDFNTFKSTTQKHRINDVDVIRQKTLKPILFTPIMLAINRTVTQLINADKVDVIHISWPNPSALLLLLNRQAKSKPWVIQWQSDMVTQHSSWLLKLAYKVFKPLEKRLIKQASLIIASSKAYVDHSIALKNRQHKCHYVPLAIKAQTTVITKADQLWAKNLWGKAPSCKVYNIGRLTFYKNHQLLLQAAKSLPDTQFIITGSGELAAQLKQSIKKLALKNILLTGNLTDSKLMALLESCDIFCLPSNDRAESFGMVLLQALALNKTILVSNLVGSGMAWVAAQTPLGMTFENNSCEDLVTKITHHLKTQQTVSYPEVFHIKHCADSIDKLYQTLRQA